MRDAKYLKYQEAGLPPPPEYLIASRRRQVPWEGLVKVVISILAAIVTGYVSLDTHVPHIKLLFINLYIIFTISGIIDLIIFYNGYSLIPEGLQSFILSGCFASESLCYFTIMTSENQHSMQIVIFLSSIISLTALLETVVDNRLIKFCRFYFTLLQGIWMIHLGRYFGI